MIEVGQQVVMNGMVWYFGSKCWIGKYTYKTFRHSCLNSPLCAPALFAIVLSFYPRDEDRCYSCIWNNNITEQRFIVNREICDTYGEKQDRHPGSMKMCTGTNNARLFTFKRDKFP